MKIKGIIFDCDGLLVDTETPDFLSWQAVFTSFGASLSFDLWQSGIGSTSVLDAYQILEEQTGKPADRASIRAVRREQYKALVMQQTLLPGVLATIQLAQQMNLKLAVASSSSFQWVSWCLENFQLTPYFETIVTADDVSLTKPNPEIYLKALERMACKPSEVIALEDSPNGVMAATQAGIFCVAVTNPMTCALDFSHASLILESLEKLDLEKLPSGTE